MKCECGHSRNSHTNTGWPRYAPYCDSFTCCSRTPNRGIGKGGSEHDFVTHQVTRCKCTEFQPQQEKEVQE